MTLQTIKGKRTACPLRLVTQRWQTGVTTTHHDGRLEAILDVVLGKVLVRDVLHEALLVHDRFAIWGKKKKSLKKKIRLSADLKMHVNCGNKKTPWDLGNVLLYRSAVTSFL